MYDLCDYCCAIMEMKHFDLSSPVEFCECCARRARASSQPGTPAGVCIAPQNGGGGQKAVGEARRLRSALTALQLVGVQPNAWVLHPTDAQTIDLTPEGTGGVGFKL